MLVAAHLAFEDAARGEHDHVGDLRAELRERLIVKLIRVDFRALADPVGFGVLGPGIGIGILTAKSSEAMGRNPDAAATIRTNMIIGAALAEGLGILAFVLGILLSGKTV